MNNQPTEIIDNLPAFIENPLSIEIKLEPGVSVVNPVTAVIGIGGVIQDMYIPVITTGSEIDFTITVQQLKQLPLARKKSTVYIRFADRTVFTIPLQPTVDGSVPQPRSVQIFAPGYGIVRTSVYDEKGFLQRAESAAVIAEAAADRASTFSVNGRPVNPASTPLEGEEIVQALTAGTYVNFGNLVVTSDDVKKIVRLYKIGSVWSKDVKDISSSFINLKIPTSKNLFDKDSVINDRYVDSTNGSVATMVGMKMSELFPVIPGQLYTASGIGNIHWGLYVRFVNAANVLVGYVKYKDDVDAQGSFTPPAGAAYAQATVKTARPGDNINLDTLQIEAGPATAYAAYSSIVAKRVDGFQVVPEPTLPESPVSKQYAENNFAAYIPTKVPTSKNLFDKSTVIAGSYVSDVNGTIQSAAGFSMSALMAVIPNKMYSITGLGTVHHGLYVRFVDANNVQVGYALMAGSDMISGSFVSPDNAVYAQYTTKTNKAGDNNVLDNIQVELGEGTAFTPFTSASPGILPTPLANNKVLTPPSEDDDITSKGFLDENFVKITEDAIGKNKFNKNTLVNDNYVDPTTGALTFGANSKSSAIIPCVANTKYSLSGFGTVKFPITVRFLNAAGVYISHVNSTSEQLSFSFVTPSNAARLQHTVKTIRAGDNTVIDNIQLELGEVSPKENYQPAKGFSFQKRTGRNRFDKSKVIAGSYVDSLTGAVANSAGTAMSEITPVAPSTIYTLSGLGSLRWNNSFRFVDEFGAQVGFLYGPQATSTVFTFATPKRARGVQFTVKTARPDDNTNPANLMLEEKPFATLLREFNTFNEKTYDFPVSKVVNGRVYGDLVDDNSAVNKYHLDSRTRPTKDLIALFFGDSIWEQVRADGSTKINWPNYIEYLEFAEIRNYAKSGAAYRDRPSPVIDWQKISYQIDQAIASGIIPHMICFGAGTNDGITDLGDYATAMSKTTLASLDRTKFYEAVRYAYWKCRTQWPNVIMMAATPLQRTSDTPETLEPMYQAIKKMANRYGVIVADATYETRIVRDFENNGSPGRYLTDGLHPNDDGQRVYAQYMAGKILQVLQQ